jgi:nitrous oxidase accessory protein NosD
LLLWLLLGTGLGTAHALTLARDTRWSGELRFAESVVVPNGVSLEIAAGTKIHFTAGGLEVAGRLTAGGATFTGDKWSGLTLKGCDEQTRLMDVTVRGATTGILVQGGAPRLEGLVMEGNEVGVELRGKTAATLRNSRFLGNRKVGLFVKDDSVATVSGCRFENNGRFGAYIYRANPGRFAQNHFESNPVGLMIAYFGSEPLVEENLFVDNEVGIEVDRAARPRLHGNRLQKNRIALSLQRRADPEVTANRFVGNQVAVKVAYSSYPKIHGNDFTDNGMAVKCELQSAAWEREHGEAARTAGVAAAGAFGAAAGAQNVSEEQRRPGVLDGSVDARGNWWGTAGSLELVRVGEQGNPSFIHDGRDQPVFVEQGKSYPLDTVAFAPWSATSCLRGGQ